MRNDRPPPDDGPLSVPRSFPPTSLAPSSVRPASSSSIQVNPIIPGWPIVEPGLLMAMFGRVMIIHNSAEISIEGQRRHLEELARAIDLRTTPIGVLYDVPSAKSFGAMDRKEGAAILKAREEKLGRLTTAYAMATPSILARGILNAIFWLAPPPYRYAVVSTVTEGLDFLATYTEGLNPRLIEEEYRWLFDRHAKIIDPKRARTGPDPDKEQKAGPASRRGASLK